MEWINIEKKWNEMARRLQNAGSEMAEGKTGAGSEGARTEPEAAPAAETIRIDKLETRAMA